MYSLGPGAWAQDEGRKGMVEAPFRALPEGNPSQSIIVCFLPIWAQQRGGQTALWFCVIVSRLHREMSPALDQKHDVASQSFSLSIGHTRVT